MKNNVTVVEELLQGSENINRMRREIDQVVRMVWGLAYDARGGTQRTAYDSTFPCDSTDYVMHWRIMGSKVSLWKIGSVSIQLYCAVEGAEKINVEFVQVVHENLTFFVRGMVELFPGLQQKMEPFIKASKVF